MSNDQNRPPAPLPIRKKGDHLSARQWNAVVDVINRTNEGVQIPRQVDHRGSLAAQQWYPAKTCTATIGQNLRVNIFENGATSAATKANVQVFAPFLATTDAVPVGRWMLVTLDQFGNWQAAPFGGFNASFTAKTTVQTTGQTVTADIYENGSQAAATILGASIYCPMLTVSSVIAVGVYVRAQQINGVWEGYLNVAYPEPV